MKKQELIEKLKTSGTLTSNVFLSLTDVITLVEQLEDEPTVMGLSEEQKGNIADTIANHLSQVGVRLLDSYDLDAYSNGSTVEVTVDDIQIDTEQVTLVVDRVLKNY